MYMDDQLKIDIEDLITTTAVDSQITITPESFNDNNDMTYILSYALPISCLAIMIVLLLAVAIHRRQRILEKWTSLKRMKNTNPRLSEQCGLRRDSEYESYSSSTPGNVTIINEPDQISEETEYKLATIT